MGGEREVLGGKCKDRLPHTSLGCVLPRERICGQELQTALKT